MEAVVLRRSDSGENDRRLTLLTREFGRLDVIAKGARKSGSRLAGSSEPLVRGQFNWAEGRHRRFVTQVQPITSYPRIRTDYSRLMAALSFAEVISWAMPSESPSEELYDLCLESLAYWDIEFDSHSVLAWSLARALEEEGHGPAWTRCQDTGEKLAWTPGAVSVSHGGLLRTPKLSRIPDVIWVDAEVLVGLEKVGKLVAPPTTFKHAVAAVEILVEYWSNLLEHDLPTCRAFLRETSSDGE